MNINLYSFKGVTQTGKITQINHHNFKTSCVKDTLTLVHYLFLKYFSERQTEKVLK